MQRSQRYIGYSEINNIGIDTTEEYKGPRPYIILMDTKDPGIHRIQRYKEPRDT